MTRPVILVNPAARRLARKPRLLAEIGAIAAGRADVIVCPSLLELDAAAREVLDRGAEAVLLVGGDGTVMTTLTALDRARGQRALPNIALAHAGTMGTIARGLGAPRSLLRAVRMFCRQAPYSIAEQPTLRALSEDGGSRVGFIFATGLVARFFEKYDAAGGGYPVAVRIATSLFVGALAGARDAVEAVSPMPCRISADGLLLEPEAWGVIVSSVLKDVGLHIRVTYRGGEDPLRPHVVATPLGPRGLALNFPRVLAGLGIVGPGTLDNLVGTLQLDFGEHPGSWIFDGDTVRSRTVELSAGPVVRVLRMK